MGLDTVELVMAVEDKFEVEVEATEAEKFIILRIY
tara:strand:+ start:398 stop:502 length:105 start_codon:yes stop_codon:yes gene_type:complete